MTCIQPERIPLNCPNCNMHIGYYIQLNNAVYVMLGLTLVQSFTGQCFCGHRFVNMAMPKSFDKLKRRYYERLQQQN